MCFSILCSSYYFFYDISAPVERAPTIRSGYACLPVCQHVAVYAVGYHDYVSNCKKSSYHTYSFRRVDIGVAGRKLMLFARHHQYLHGGQKTTEICSVLRGENTSFLHGVIVIIYSHLLVITYIVYPE